MKKQLISTDDLNLELENEITTNNYRWIKSLENTLFNNTNLSLGQFIPCNLKGNVLEKPAKLEDFILLGSIDSMITSDEWEDIKQYQEAEKRLVFDGFKIKYKYILKGDKSTFWVVYKDLKVCYYENNKCTFAGKYKTFQDLIKFNLTLK